MKHVAKIALLFTLYLLGCEPSSQPPQLEITGAMHRVMREGKLEGMINLDTIQNKEHLFGVGPLAFLRGEILILDGQAYVSRATPDSTIVIEENWQAQAPFFVAARVPAWEEVSLPDSVRTIPQLENFLLQLRGDAEPFPFKLTGNVAFADIHIVNLPPGSAVSSPQEAHVGLQHFYLENEPVDMVGFFSTQHQTVFTHHDSYVHMHLITQDRKKMGHLDAVQLQPSAVSLWLPKG